MGRYREVVEATLKKWLKPEELPRPVVDLGGRSYREWMKGILGNNFETWDMLTGDDVTRVVDATKMRGIESASLGTIVCASAMEHFDKPWNAAAQMARVTRPGGVLFVSVPFMFDFHEQPKDYWRYTPDALRVLFGSNYTEISCDWAGKHHCFFYGRRGPKDLTLKAAIETATKIMGLIDEAEIEFLYTSSAQSVKGGDFVELGTYLGRSCSVLCYVAASRGKIPTSIDNYQYRLTCNENRAWKSISAFGLNANLVRADSRNVPDGIKNVSALFIDSTHTKEHFSAEAKAWLPHVLSGGVVICHDYSSQEWPEMRPVIDATFQHWHRIGTAGRMIAFKKP